ncbi:hypothetical protein L249_8659 [Ophiocordyceps polyrhachis-furcata BCC 54312]|uniref:DBF4-type domain-containing protein n=1 Tax=Ophiocordyceps polyrhachis-furcata BCC 54312 TaxID=1330021 RepID=A0A367L7B7_9HYPO|nr:hypothetical protein L249_8659 [Ophiocordyceps polyrhachis-furcata BCC 54312]
MAAVSLSPTPAAMSTRRAPLANNPNAANSPLRGASTLPCYAKQKRAQREDAYVQPPPVKKQALENGSQRAIRSPGRPLPPRAQVLVQRTSTSASRSANKDRISRAASAFSAHNADNEKEAWKKHYRAKFPKMVFYFESIPDDVRAKLTKRVTYFGARQEPFFSIDVTHVITTRTIPPERAEGSAQALAASPETDQQRKQQSEEQPQTINPSLLDRNPAARRKLLFEFRQPPSSSQQLKKAGNGNGKPKNNDVLHKAREMGKKIWSLEKFQTMLTVLLESESLNSARNPGARNPLGAFKNPQEPDLLQLLNNERINGPSDRDPTAVSRELVYFKGPYIYVWDMDEKQKPMMVRDYPKVANKADGEWPQFRSVANGRCPFVEDVELMPERKDYRKSREREKARAAAAAAAAATATAKAAPTAAAAAKRHDDVVPMLKPPETVALGTGKRTFAEMEDAGRNALATRTAAPVPLLVSGAAKAQATQNAFISRASACPGRLLGGEPLASGMQPSNVTSAIRSQMISSTSGINGGKAGTSKEVHGLQRKVLQKTTASASHDPSPRRLTEVSADAVSSRSMSRQTSRTVHAQEDEGRPQRAAAAATATPASAKSRSQRTTLRSKKDLKPGYCENCQEKFPDFDDHIISRKHRNFAENNDNWTELDSLLDQLKRIPKYHDGSGSEW